MVADAPASEPSTPSDAAPDGPAPGASPDGSGDGQGPPPEGPGPGIGSRLWARLDGLTLAQVVILIAALAVLARLLFLGERAAHFDEARVAHWVDYYAETGHFTYRHIIHGPLIQHVDRVLVWLLGNSEFVMRLPVAVLGGLLPAAALLYRRHLRDHEVVILALFLAGNAIMVYYSRFMRSDLLLAAAMFTAFGCILRFYDTRRYRWLYGAAVLVALGFAAKENAVAYLLTWVGATALLADHAMFRPRNYPSGLARLRASWLGAVGAWLLDTLAAFGTWLGALWEEGADSVDVVAPLRRRAARTRAMLARPASPLRRVLRVSGHTLGIAVAAAAVLLFLYAPRGDGLAGLYIDPRPELRAVGFWEGVTNPGKFPTMVEGTVSHTLEEFASWFGASGSTGDEASLMREIRKALGDSTHVTASGEVAGEIERSINVLYYFKPKYLDWVGRFAQVFLNNALVLSVAAVVGFLYERFVATDSRNLVMFTSYIGVVSFLAYPLGMDVFGAWHGVHVVVAVAVPAAVGLGVVYRWGRAAAVRRDHLATALAVVVLVFSSIYVVQVNATGVYTNYGASDNNLAQFAGPQGDLEPFNSQLRRFAAENEGTDVVVYGDNYVSGTSNSLDWRPRCMGPNGWFTSLPVPWYLVKHDAEVACATNQTHLEELVADRPPMVLTDSRYDSTIEDELSGYNATAYLIRKTKYADSDEMVVFLREDLLAGR